MKISVTKNLVPSVCLFAVLLTGDRFTLGEWEFPESFATSFDGPTLDSHLEDSDRQYTIDGTAHQTSKTIGGPGADRHYIRTVASSFNEVDFTYELSVFLTDRNPCCDDHLFVGMGQAVASSYYGEPDNSIFINPHAANQLDGVVRFTYIVGGDPISIQPEIGNLNSTREHRIRMTKQQSLLSFEVDEDFKGTFAADFTSGTVDLDDPSYAFLDNRNSHLFFGTGGPMPRFDNMVVQVSSTFLPADFNDDGIIGLADFDILKGNFGLGPAATRSHGDANNDGYVVLTDFDVLKRTFGRRKLVELPTDFNFDGFVDLADFRLLKTNFGLGPGAIKSHGDADNDGYVVLADFNLLKSDFGHRSSVPEPTTFVLLTSALFLIAFVQRK